MNTETESAFDFVVNAGPRAFTPETPDDVRLEIAKSKSLSWYKQALIKLARRQRKMMFAEIREIARQNRRIEKEMKACNGLGLPDSRIPMGVYLLFESMYGHGCWKWPGFREDFLKHHPELRLRVRRGTRGQEYGG
jgi:hypothetical protein